jgi:hypothetical protein
LIVIACKTEIWASHFCNFLISSCFAFHSLQFKAQDKFHCKFGQFNLFFRPNEIEVKVVGENLIVHFLHEERSDVHGTIKREINRRYGVLPNKYIISTFLATTCRPTLTPAPWSRTCPREAFSTSRLWRSTKLSCPKFNLSMHHSLPFRHLSVYFRREFASSPKCFF